MTDDTSTNDTSLESRVRRGRPPRQREEVRAPEREPQGRAKRVPLGVPSPKLAASQRPGYVRRWINDSGSRLELAQQAGYGFVTQDMKAATTDQGSAFSQVVGTKEGGGSLRAYLMEIREEWYAEDQNAKQASVDATEQLIKRGELVGKVGQEGVYVPQRGIRITRTSR